MTLRFLLRRVLVLVLSLLLVASLTFFLMKTIPGDPFLQEQGMPEEILKNMRKHYGLDQPWYIQYTNYLKGLLTWNLGPSFKYEGRTVNEIICEGFPVSFCLGFEAICISLSSGIFLGILAATRHGRWQDYLCMTISVVGISVPNFIMATLLQFLFAMKWDLLPVARWGDFTHSILPAFSLAALPTAFIARLTRSSAIEVLEQDYIQTARAKGLSEVRVVFRHVLKNSLFPVLSYLGPFSSVILTGSFIVEKIFGIPGLGEWFVTSISNRDYTVIMGVTIFYSALLMVNVFVIDLLYTIIDPRIQFEEKVKA